MSIYQKDLPPTSPSIPELVAWLERELEKIRVCLEQVDERLRALEP